MRSLALIVFTLISVGLPARLAKAELPTFVYQRMQANAKEFLHIEVTDVVTQDIGQGETAVTVTAQVTGVKRSASRLQPGATITVTYTSHNRAIIGPSPSPILKRGDRLTAYLNPSNRRGVFVEAALGRSFVTK